MSTIHQSIRTITGGGADYSSYVRQPVEVWTKPVEWKDLPTLTETDEEINFLLHLRGNVNEKLSFLVIANGTFQIDWGDGTIETGLTSAAHEHNYNISALPNTNLSAEGEKQVIVRITPTTTGGSDFLRGIQLTSNYHPSGYQDYYGNKIVDFQASLPNATSGSSLVEMNWGNYQYGITANGLQRIRVHSGGQGYFDDYAFCNLRQLETVSLPASMPNWNNGADYLFNGCFKLHTIEQIDVSSITNCNSMFGNCANLRVIPALNFANATSVTNLFQNNFSLDVAPDVTIPDGCNVNGMFTGCTGLRVPPNVNFLGSVGNMSGFYTYVQLPTDDLIFPDYQDINSLSGLFFGRYDLKEVDIDLTGRSNVSSMFHLCKSLEKVTLRNIDTTWTSVTSMFNSCNSLKYIETPGGTPTITGSMSSMFQNCWALKNIPNWDYTGVTALNSAFANMYALFRFEGHTFSNVTAFNAMFNGCVNLEYVNFTINDPGAAVNYQTMFSGCYKLKTIGPDLDFSFADTSSKYNSMFNQCRSLKEIESASTLIFSFSITTLNWEADALDNLYTNLPTVVGQTLTVTGNIGVSGDDPTIATAKGWTVTG